MNRLAVDLAILGSGFSGSLMAMVARRLGLTVVLVDRSSHPRFAIGESSTPIANFILRDLASRYDLLRLVPLCKFGEWQRHYPELGCGLKRGFTYFQHTPNAEFATDSAHSRELAVAASRSDELSDTHWLRSDLDTFLVTEAVRLGAEYWDRTSLDQIDRGPPWQLAGIREQTRVEIRAQFVLDGTGEAGLLPKYLGLAARTNQLHTRSRAVFSHFHGVQPFQDVLRQQSVRLEDYPFSCDDAAQHQILDRAWIWMLRFRDDLASVGLVIDMEREQTQAPLPDPTSEWQSWLERFPTIGRMLRDARFAASPGKLIGTHRLQRQWSTVAGPDWALLPHTAGFVDPLHSSGLAHSLCGVERLARILELHWGEPTLPPALNEYQRAFSAEIEVIDRLVHGCFLTFGDFPLTVAYAMLYFAAATTYEQRRGEDGYDPRQWFLGADDENWLKVLRRLHKALIEWRNQGRPAWPDFPEIVKKEISPYNHVGLCSDAAQNMYRYTAPEIG